MSSEPDRLPLTPGPPARLLAWLHGSPPRRHRLGLPVWARIAAGVLAAVALGTWGYHSLAVKPRLDLLQSTYAAVKLFTLDLGPASGGSPGPNPQVWIALLLAAGMVARGVLALLRERLRGAAVRHLLHGHVVICGAGMHGTRLARELGQRHDVVLVDLDAGAPGMQEPRGRHEWRLVGDAVSERTLLDAGAPRANWLIAVTGQDFVNSQIVSSARSLAAAQRLRDRAHVLVQIEDPVLTRFLEEESEGHEDSELTGGPRAVVSPFSTNTIAAEALLDEAKVQTPGGDAPLVSMRAGRAPSLLLAGDHPLIDALVLAALRRWRVRSLREVEQGSGHVRPPLHVSVFGPGAEARMARLRRRWQPETGVLALEARNSPPPGEDNAEAEEWLRRPGRADHAVVAASTELEGIALTLGLARVLGGGARMTRVSTQFENALDAHVEQRTARSGELATTEVRSLADLGARPELMSRLPILERLVQALQAREDPERARARATALLARPGLEVRADSGWRIREPERPLAQSLLELPAPLASVPLSALLRAGLRITLDSPENLLEAARRLSRARDDAAFGIWCEYVRHLAPGAGGAELAELAELAEEEADPAAHRLLELRRAAAGESAALNGLQPDGQLLRGAQEVAILAGGAGSMSTAARRMLEPLLDQALSGFAGTLLSGGTDSGLPGIVGRLAQARGLALIGYAPIGQADRNLYPSVRETPESTEFSALEPLAMWTEILAAGFAPQAVRLLACPGGQITIQEVLLARALGARVAWLDPAAESARTLDELLPLGSAGVVELPADPMTVRAFLSATQVPEPLRSALARRLHDDYRRRQRARKEPDDPALACWEDLPPTLQASNLGQADDIPGKLKLIGKRLVAGGEPLELSAEQVERLAEVEHGRWNFERLSGGWRMGLRQVERTRTPNLRPWSELPDEVREYDREAVRNIAGALADTGWGVSDG